MGLKQIAFTITDSGIDGMAKLSIVQAFWSEPERDKFLECDKNKAYRSIGEMIVDPEQARRRALAKLDGLDKLALGVK